MPWTFHLMYSTKKRTKPGFNLNEWIIHLNSIKMIRFIVVIKKRSHSSLFYTNGTMNSIDQNDYLNKFIVCDSEGHVIVSSASNPKYWIPKNQLMFNSFSVRLIWDYCLLQIKSNYFKVYSISKWPSLMWVRKMCRTLIYQKTAWLRLTKVGKPFRSIWIGKKTMLVADEAVFYAKISVFYWCLFFYFKIEKICQTKDSSRQHDQSKLCRIKQSN